MRFVKPSKPLQLKNTLMILQSIGHPESMDPVAHGLANLFYWATSFAKGSQKRLTTRYIPGVYTLSKTGESSDSFSNIGLDLLRKQLFPELSTEEVTNPRVPLLNTMTRQLIAETIYFLVKDDEEQYKDTLVYCASLVPYEPKMDGMYLKYFQIYKS